MAKKLKGVPKGEEINDSISKHIYKNYLSSLDVAGSSNTELTIDRVEKHKSLPMEGAVPKENAILLYFRETPKPMILNATNRKAIILKTKSAKVSDWKGVKLKLYTIEGTWFGEKQLALRVK